MSKASLAVSPSALKSSDSAFSTPGYKNVAPTLSYTYSNRKGDLHPTNYLPSCGSSAQNLKQSNVSDWTAEIQEAMNGVRFVAEHMMGDDDDQSVCIRIRTFPDCLSAVLEYFHTEIRERERENSGALKRTCAECKVLLKSNANLC